MQKKKKIYQSIVGWPSMGATFGESVGGCRAPGGLQTESVDAESTNGRIESDEDIGDQIRRGSSTTPKSGHSYRRE